MYDRDRILLETDLAALCDDVLGPRRGSGRSATWPCPDPHHAQTGRTPPLTVYRGRSGYERWHCHGCGAGGTAVDLVLVARGGRPGDALAFLAGRIGLAEDDRALLSRSPRQLRPVEPTPREVTDPEGLARYVRECAERLWRPDGRVVRLWLTSVRGIPENILDRNGVGADPGAHRQPRPDGIPRIFSRAAVFPVVEQDRAVFAQLRLLHPGPVGPRYLNAASSLAPNPKVALYEPCERAGECVVVTEGPTDGLSAAAGGFRAAAVLGTGVAGPTVAKRLAALGAPLVVAFDPDNAGSDGAFNLLGLLRAEGAPASRLHVPSGHDDLNDWMRARADDWTATLTVAVRGATRSVATHEPLGLGH